MEADFLLELAHSARIIILPCVHVARSRGVPDAGLSILFHGSLLEEDVSGSVEHQDMRRAVHQSKPMNFGPGLLTDHLVLGIHDVKNFIHAGQMSHMGHLSRKVNLTLAAEVAKLPEGSFQGDRTAAPCILP